MIGIITQGQHQTQDTHLEDLDLHKGILPIGTMLTQSLGIIMMKEEQLKDPQSLGIIMTKEDQLIGPTDHQKDLFTEKDHPILIQVQLHY